MREKIKSNFQKFLDVINNKGNIVKLEKKGERIIIGFNGEMEAEFKFEVKFKINDIYVDREVYEKGQAIIYLNDKFYNDIDEFAKKYLGEKPIWNNTKTVGWFILYN